MEILYVLLIVSGVLGILLFGFAMYFDDLNSKNNDVLKKLECSQCHHSFKGKYCSECGNPIWFGISNPEEDYCSVCSAKVYIIDKSNKVCYHCGNALELVRKSYSYTETLALCKVKKEKFENELINKIKY